MGVFKGAQGRPLKMVILVHLEVHTDLNLPQSSPISSKFVQIQFVFLLGGQKMQFQISVFKRQNLTLRLLPSWQCHFWQNKQFFFSSQGSQMAFSDFPMKKNVFGQIWKALKWVAGYSETLKFILPFRPFLGVYLAHPP